MLVSILLTSLIASSCFLLLKWFFLENFLGVISLSSFLPFPTSSHFQWWPRFIFLFRILGWPLMIAHNVVRWPPAILFRSGYRTPFPIVGIVAFCSFWPQMFTRSSLISLPSCNALFMSFQNIHLFVVFSSFCSSHVSFVISLHTH